VLSAPLLPKDDPSVLLNSAGMQQFKPYFVGAQDAMADFGSLNATSIQKCFRTVDIDEVGDETHLTFFEMMGNFSFGGYGKPEAIAYAWEFLNSAGYLNIPASRLSATYYNGNRPGTVADDEARILLEGLSGLSQITPQPDTDNFWGPTGTEGPCGPTVEFYVDGVEVWNLVFNEFYSNADKSLSPLKTRGVDTGMGLERLLAALHSLPNVYETDVLKPLTQLASHLPVKSQRIIADHARGTVFLLADKVMPSNKEQGYILRRILRRLILHIQGSGIGLETVLQTVIDLFAPVYPELTQNSAEILTAARAEADKFSRTIDLGERELVKFVDQGKTELTGEEAFKLFASYGLPIDFIKEKISVDVPGFDAAFAAHQAISRAGVEQKFGGHGLSAGAAVSEEDRRLITRLHTATHLLHAALREVLGDEAQQSGSDITPERTRFDFSFPRKLSPEEIKAVEDWVNAKISTGFVVKKETLPYTEAISSGAIAFFKEKYPEVVTVYTLYNEAAGEVVSRELCGGPHVESSSELGHFKITKEESSSAGIRRIKAILEK